MHRVYEGAVLAFSLKYDLFLSIVEIQTTTTIHKHTSITRKLSNSRFLPIPLIKISSIVICDCCNFTFNNKHPCLIISLACRYQAQVYGPWPATLRPILVHNILQHCSIGLFFFNLRTVIKRIMVYLLFSTEQALLWLSCTAQRQPWNTTILIMLL